MANPETTTPPTRYNLGDKWKCQCGATHELTGAYLAAHWDIELTFNCDCGRVHILKSGKIRLIKEPK